MIKEVNGIIDAVMKAKSMDWRTCYASVRALEPSGDKLIIQVSDRSVLDMLKGRIRSVYSDKRNLFTFRLLPQESSDLPEIFIVSGSVADIRKEPAHSAELLTQAICGDILLPLKIEGDWILVKLDDGYIGWVRSWNVKATTMKSAQNFLKRAGGRIAGNVVQVFKKPDSSSLPVGEGIIGTLVITEPGSRRGWRKITFPDERRGFVRASGVEARPKSKRISASKLAATGLKFLGIPYIWGGTTPKGFDCSGLMQRIFRLNGLLIPRDADMQAGFGLLKPSRDMEKLKTGDLLFFGKKDEKISHVAMYLSEGLFLHAYGQVKVGSMDPKNPLFDAKLFRDWHFSRGLLLR